MTNVLLVEDNPTISSMLRDTLAQIPGVEVKLATQPSTAHELIKATSFGVALIDLKLMQSPETGPGKAIYNGIQLGEVISNKSSGTVIVMYSGDIVPGNEASFSRYADCLDAGADYVVARETLTSKGASAFGKAITEWIQKKGGEAELARPLQHERDWNTLAVIEDIGKECLAQLIHLAIPVMARDCVRALRPGYSGAYILWIASSTNGSNYDVETILKVSKSPWPLQEELRRLPTVGSALDLHSVTPHTGCVEWNGWYAIGIRPVKGAVLLREFLLKSKTKQGDKRLFGDMICDLLVPSAQVAKPPPQGSKRLLGYQSGIQILESLDEIAGWTAVTGSVRQREVQLVKKFIERSLNGHWNVCGNHHIARLHGDFHCRNVFVCPTARAVLIDFGRSADYPRLLDFAALEVDLLLSLFRSPGGADLQFNKLDQWYAFVCAGLPSSRRR